MKGFEHIEKMNRKHSYFHHLDSAIDIYNICVFTYPSIYPFFHLSVIPSYF